MQFFKFSMNSRKNRILLNVGFILAYIGIFSLPFLADTCNYRTKVLAGFELKSAVLAHIIFSISVILDLTEKQPTRPIRVTVVVLSAVLLFYLMTIFYLLMEMTNMSSRIMGCIDQLYGYSWSLFFGILYLVYAIVQLDGYKREQ